MTGLQTLEQACTPRQSVYEPGVADTVYNIDDLEQIDPRHFFAENFITEGMKLLLTEAFKRLEGKSASASGTFLLSQSMGGGKTHNLLALGLLARYPQWRGPVMSGFYQPGPLGAVRVVSFSGRTTHTPLGLWGEIAAQLNKKDALKDFYSPLQAPGDKQWTELLRGEPLLILLDELPPYFEAMKAIAVGSTHLDVITSNALANLLVAVNSGRLANVCVVITDLSGTAHAAGGAALHQAVSSQGLGDLEKEVHRSVVRVDPVRINTNELYDILRTRLFQSLPSEEAIDAVAEAYRQAVDKAKLMDITAASPEQIKTEVRNAYPFHPAIRDLYARFKENPGFQQTRALIRIMRLIVAGLWSSGEARRQYLVGAEDLDLHRQEILSEVRQINSTLDTAVAHDIAATGGGSVAEQIDRGESSDAQDVCRLVFLSSLSQAMNPTLGLDRSDIVRSLATPGRDPTNLRAAIDRLQSEAWYLHATRDGKLLFRNTENLIAKLDSYTKNKLKEQKEGELRERLQEMFAPKLKSCYQELLCLPALDQVQLSQDSVTLIIFRPVPGAVDDIRQFYEHQQYKNRVMFLTGSAPAYETVLQRAASLSAIRAIIGEMKTEGRQESDPQFIDAETIKTKQESLFYQACRETFQTLHYPSKNELTPLELDPKYVANEYKGEDQVRDALKEAYKYREDTSAESSSFRTSLENKLWPATQKEVPWSSIKQRAATDPSWVWQHPRALDDLKTELIKRDIWREHGTFVERGPFPQPQASLTVQVVSRNEKTGETTLRLRPLHGDIVYKTESGLANTNSERLENFEITTKALRLSFLAADSSGEHETGEPQDWKATISLKHRFYQDADNRRCELQALPGGTIRYSIDGSGPESYGHVYSEPFTVPADCRVVLAIAGDDGVSSPVARFDVPRVVGEGSAAVVASVDPGKPVTWRRVQRRDDTNATYIWLELAQKYRARLGGVRLQAAFGTRWVELRTAEDVSQPANQVLEQASLLKTIVPEGNVDLDVESLHFESGRDLQDMVADMKETLLSSEVEQ